MQTVNLAPNESRTIRLNPELLPQAFLNGEIRPATLEVRANILGTTLGYNETRPVYLHSVSDFFWGDKLANAQFIARWVTPHDPAVMKLVSSARNYVRRGRLAGYELPGSSAPAVAVQVEDEARGVFAAMEHLGLSYVDSVSTYGNFASKTERVRLPSETLSMDGANCIDMSVAFASAMENLGMEPVIVLVPGHAFTGVRLGHGSSQILYLDLTVAPDGTFEAAVQRAQGWLQKTPKAQVNLIDISTARSHQIYPMAENLPQIVASKSVVVDRPTGSMGRAYAQFSYGETTPTSGPNSRSSLTRILIAMACCASAQGVPGRGVGLGIPGVGDKCRAVIPCHRSEGKCFAASIEGRYKSVKEGVTGAGPYPCIWAKEYRGSSWSRRQTPPSGCGQWISPANPEASLRPIPGALSPFGRIVAPLIECGAHRGRQVEDRFRIAFK